MRHIRHVLLAVAALGATAAALDPFREIQSPDRHEAPSEFLQGGKTIYFTRADAEFKTSTVLQATFEKGRWRPTGPAPFATSHYDSGASLSPDGRFLYFTTLRPGSGFKDAWNIWSSERDRSGGFRPPEPLPAPINSDKSDCCLTAKAAGVVYFSSERNGAWEIFRAEKKGVGRWSDPIRLPDSINASKQGQWPSYVDPKERFLIFSSIRADGHGGDDLWIAFRTEAGWGAPRNLGPLVNTKGFEDSGILSNDQKRFLWSSRTEGTSDIREIEVARLGISGLTSR